eukprot:1144401-Pelagomonas_calceolata.AAC.1
MISHGNNFHKSEHIKGSYMKLESERKEPENKEGRITLLQEQGSLLKLERAYLGGSGMTQFAEGKVKVYAGH